MDPVQGKHHLDGGTVRVGHDAAAVPFQEVAVDLGHHQRDGRVHAEGRRVVDDHAPRLCRYRGILPGHRGPRREEKIVVPFPHGLFRQFLHPVFPPVKLHPFTGAPGRREKADLIRPHILLLKHPGHHPAHFACGAHNRYLHCNLPFRFNTKTARPRRDEPELAVPPLLDGARQSSLSGPVTGTDPGNVLRGRQRPLSAPAHRALGPFPAAEAPFSLWALLSVADLWELGIPDHRFSDITGNSSKRGIFVNRVRDAVFRMPVRGACYETVCGGKTPGSAVAFECRPDGAERRGTCL